MRAIGVLGGTFDPIHYGHLRLAEEMAEVLDLAEVRFIPAGRPPHREAPATGALHRLEMTRRAIASNSRFVVDDREVRMDRASYTVDTLTELRAELDPAQPVFLLLGADAFWGLPTWHDWTRLFDLAHIAVAERPGSRWLQSDALPDPLTAEVHKRQTAGPTAPAGAVLFKPMTPLGISATAIRDALARGHSARYLTPDAVLDYIHTFQLYRHP